MYPSVGVTLEMARLASKATQAAVAVLPRGHEGREEERLSKARFGAPPVLGDVLGRSDGDRFGVGMYPAIEQRIGDCKGTVGQRLHHRASWWNGRQADGR